MPSFQSSTTIVVQGKNDKVSPLPSKTPHSGSEATSSATAATTYSKKVDVAPRAGTRGSKPFSLRANVKPKGEATVEGA